MGVALWLGIIALLVILFFIYMTWKAHKEASSPEDYNPEEYHKGFIGSIGGFLSKCCKRIGIK